MHQTSPSGGDCRSKLELSLSVPVQKCDAINTIRQQLGGAGLFISRRMGAMEFWLALYSR
jgi:hypothetical protein